jgi:hypothetical protein
MRCQPEVNIHETMWMNEQFSGMYYSASAAVFHNLTIGEYFVFSNLSLSKPPFKHGVLRGVGLGMALCDRHEAGILVQLELQDKGQIVSSRQVLPVVDMASGDTILVQLLEPVQHNHVGQLGLNKKRLPLLNIRPTLGVLLLGSLYLIVLHIVLALALDIALGAMLLLLLLMVLGIALPGDFIAAFGIASALDDLIGHHCSACPVIWKVAVLYTKQGNTGEQPQCLNNHIAHMYILGSWHAESIEPHYH